MTPGHAQPALPFDALAFAGSKPGVQHFCRMISNVSGQDRAFMLLQYSSKLVIAILSRKAQAPDPLPSKRGEVIQSLTKLSAKLSDARCAWRSFGLAPTAVWWASLQKSTPRSQLHGRLERAQCLLIVIYYMLEHTYYLGALTILKIQPETVKKAGLWSARAWLAYVILQFVKIREEYDFVRRDEQEVARTKTGRAEVRAKRWALDNNFLVYLGYLPLSVHWALENGWYSNELWTGIFGTLAGFAQVRGSWRASA